MNQDKTCHNRGRTAMVDPSAAADIPKISIVTPSFNQGEYLESTIRSVLEQGYPAVEYIVADGGSTDGSCEVLRRYESRIADWFSERDDGQADAIDKGFSRATGEVLAWLNSDDTYLPGALSTVMKEFMDDPSLDVVYGDLIVVNSDGAFVDDWKVTDFDMRACIYLDRGILQPAAFWRRSAFEAVGGLNTQLQFAMDLDLFLRMALRGLRFKHVRQPLATFRVSGTNKSCLIPEVGVDERRDLLAQMVGVDLDSRSFAVKRKIELFRQGMRFVRAGDASYALRRVLRSKSW